MDGVELKEMEEVKLRVSMLSFFIPDMVAVIVFVAMLIGTFTFFEPSKNHPFDIIGPPIFLLITAIFVGGCCGDIKPRPLIKTGLPCVQ